MNRLLIVIPAYNEEESIEEVVNNIKENYSQFDYVIVNDGSKDSTYSVCEKNKYNIIDLPINLGLAGGFQAGAKICLFKRLRLLLFSLTQMDSIYLNISKKC